jgi:predicted anti-sigma-YlaC factor YlaD
LCTEVRNSLSAALDGEQPSLPADVVDHHLRACLPCREWSQGAAELHRAFRVRSTDLEPDGTYEIMAALPRGRRFRDERVAMLRVATFVVALVQLVTALPLLLEDGSIAGHAMDGHLERHIGIFALALAVGLFLVAWRPERARAMLPVLGVLVVGLIWSCFGDVWSGRPVPGSVLAHLADVAAFATVWCLARIDGAPHRVRRHRAVLG